MRFGIYDAKTRRLYLEITFPTRLSANIERAAMLRHHATSSEWFARLQVVELAEPRKDREGLAGKPKVKDTCGGPG